MSGRTRKRRRIDIDDIIKNDSDSNDNEEKLISMKTYMHGAITPTLKKIETLIDTVLLTLKGKIEVNMGSGKTSLEIDAREINIVIKKLTGMLSSEDVSEFSKDIFQHATNYIHTKIRQTLDEICQKSDRRKFVYDVYLPSFKGKYLIDIEWSYGGFS